MRDKFDKRERERDTIENIMKIIIQDKDLWGVQFFFPSLCPFDSSFTFCYHWKSSICLFFVSITLCLLHIFVMEWIETCFLFSKNLSCLRLFHFIFFFSSKTWMSDHHSFSSCSLYLSCCSGWPKNWKGERDRKGNHAHPSLQVIRRERLFFVIVSHRKNEWDREKRNFLSFFSWKQKRLSFKGQWKRRLGAKTYSLLLVLNSSWRSNRVYRVLFFFFSPSSSLCLSFLLFSMLILAWL